MNQHVDINKDQLNICLHRIFEDRAMHMPDAVALEFGNQRLTYSELNNRANQLAHYLQNLGVGPGVKVAISLERSLEMVIGILGIIKAGGAYLPLDPHWPAKRLSFMLKESKAPVLLLQTKFKGCIAAAGIGELCLDRDWPAIARESVVNLDQDISPENLIYVIYTSGSTGRPKGCLNSHRALTNRILWMQKTYRLTQEDRVLQKTPFSFDVSAWEFLWPLTAGAALVVAKPAGHTDPAYLVDIMASQQITTAHFVPSMLSVFLEEKVQRCRSLKRIFCSGEALPYALQQRFFSRLPSVELYNLYGPTEAAIDVTHWTCRVDSRFNFVPLGYPVANTRIHILDDRLKSVPPGATGELHIGGVQVGQGYLNRPELTQEKFIPDPFTSLPGARLYKTGDLARFHTGRVIEYIGRVDNQVKIRGFRIELSEIESVLGRHPEVKENVVAADDNDRYGKRLTAYIVCWQRQPAVSGLRNWLKSQLPDFMVPAIFVFLKTLPLTANGKIDRHALPSPGNSRPALENVFSAPGTEKEKMLTKIWSEILQVHPVGIHDNFFELGGDSIRSIQVLAQAQKKGIHITLEQLFRNQTIYELVRDCQASGDQIHTAVKVEPFNLLQVQDRIRLPSGLEDAYPATRLQAGMLYHSKLQPDTAVYHDIFSYRIEAPFDKEKLEAALEQLAAHHPVLRTSFDLAHFSEPLQLVHAEAVLPLTIEDIRHLDPASQGDEIDKWIKTERKRSFDSTSAPLLRFHVHLLDGKTFHLSHSEHHAILDGWSLAAMFSELLHSYDNLLQDSSPPPTLPPPVPYSHYVALERQTLDSEKCRLYWLKKLDGHQVCKLPRWEGKPRLGPNGELAVHHVPLSSEILEGLTMLANLAGVSLKHVLLAAHIRVLSFLSGQQDILTGVATNVRPEEHGSEKTLGLFLNTLPFRIQLAGGSWRQLVREVFEVEKEFLPYRRYPLSEIQKDKGGHSLFEAPFVMVHFHVLGSVAEHGVQFTEGPFFEFTGFPFFIFFVIDPLTGEFRIRFDMNAGEFCKEQVEELGAYYTKVLASMASDPETRYESFSLLSSVEEERILRQWNDTRIDYPEACIQQLFEKQAGLTPEATALALAEISLSYADLNRCSNQVANYLVRKGVGPGVFVALCIERTIEMVVGILGILKAGGVYVPLDPAYPADRLMFMVDDCDAHVLLTSNNLKKILPGYHGRVICLDTDWDAISLESEDNLRCEENPDHSAYVMYTSGSTGRPKGVEITHRGVIRLLFGQDYVSFHAGQHHLLLAPFSFDASTFELWGALLHGAVCAIYPGRYVSVQELGESIVEHSITTLWLTASLFNFIIDEGPEILAPIKQLITGGEALSVAHVQRARKRYPFMRIINGYGPTESTTFSCCYQIEKRDMENRFDSVPIGKPISNTETYILDRDMQPVAIGVPGELYIGGAGLAKGYLNRPKLTEEKFISHPFSASVTDRLYKTGDLARYLPDGNIEFIGRRDHQVKIRGFRVELGEIETILLNHPGVKSCIVAANSDHTGNQQLIVYFVPASGSVPPSHDLRSFLASRLPTYMVPALFTTLDRIPLTPNGKVDRNALPSPCNRVEIQNSFVTPDSETEEALAVIWSHVLNTEKISTHDDFFTLGGNSLSAAQAASRIMAWFEVEIPLRMFFEHPTIATQAEYIDSLPLPDNMRS